MSHHENMFGHTVEFYPSIDDREHGSGPFVGFINKQHDENLVDIDVLCCGHVHFHTSVLVVEKDEEAPSEGYYCHCVEHGHNH